MCILQPDIKSVQIKIGIIENSLATVDSCRRQLTATDSLLSTTLSEADKSKLKGDTSLLFSKLALAESVLKANHSESLSTFRDSLRKMNELCDRCPVIRQSRWFQYSPNQRGGVETILGWLITALAVTLGAPFWFDLLSKLVSIRGANNKLTTNDDTTKPQSGGSPASPITVNVNQGTGGEAVG
jgi:hypothetical protein